MQTFAWIVSVLWLLLLVRTLLADRPAERKAKEEYERLYGSK